MSDHDKEKVESAHVTSASFELSTIGGTAKKRIWRKLDTHLLPLLILLYSLSFLSSTIVGYAAIAGMTKDLRLTGLRYNIITALFYIPFCLVEVPSNILLKVFSPSRWIPSIMVAWGTITTLMCLVNSFQGLAVARTFLGLTEGGLFPGLAYYISVWYPRQLQAERFAFFIAIGTVGGAFGGIFAYGIEHLDGKAGLHGWQWIFLVEGLTTVVVAFLCYFCVHDYPETAKFLTEEERQFVIQALVDDSKGQTNHFRKAFVWQAVTDWKTYAQAVNFMCAAASGVSVAVFTPIKVHDLGFSASTAQLLSVPPFIFGGIFTYIASVWSDRVNLRGPFIAAGSLVSMIGYIIAYTTSTPGPGYTAAIIASCGAYPSIAISLAWAGGNAGGDMKRGIVLAIMSALGSLGGVCSSFIYYQPPRFYKGHGTMMGFLSVSLVCSCIMMWTYKRLNKEKEEQCTREGIHEGMKDMYRDLADKSPLFRYVI